MFKFLPFSLMYKHFMAKHRSTYPDMIPANPVRRQEDPTLYSFLLRTIRDWNKFPPVVLNLIMTIMPLKQILFANQSHRPPALRPIRILRVIYVDVDEIVCIADVSSVIATRQSKLSLL